MTTVVAGANGLVGSRIVPVSSTNDRVW